MYWHRSLISVTLALLIYLSLPGASVAAADDAERIAPKDVDTCLACHEEQLNADKFKHSGHGKLVCQQCHRGVDRFPHPEKAIAGKPACSSCHAGQQAKIAASMHRKLSDVKTGVKNTCAVCHGTDTHAIAPSKRGGRTAHCQRCHVQETASVSTSVHHGGKGARGAGTDCLSCHGNDPHNVTFAKGSPEKTIAACQQCHAQEAMELTKGAHASGMAKKLGVNCLTCHGNNPHEIKAPTTTGSTVCQSCHIDVTAQLTVSAHGEGNTHNKKVDCTSCHGAQVHNVAPVAPRTPKQKSAMCQQCHPKLTDNLVHNIHSHLEAKARAHPQCTDCHGGNLHTVMPASQMTPVSKEAACRQCHQNISLMVETSVHSPKNTKEPFRYCTQCHARDRSQVSKSEAEHLKTLTSGSVDRTTMRMDGPNGNVGFSVTRVQDHVIITSETACRECHKKNAAEPMHSRHDKADKVAGDHPTCFTCHGGGPHEMARPKDLSKQAKVRLCVQCHGDEELMKRYGMTTEPVESYLRSFHGKAVMRFKQTDAAICVDCHGLHAVLPPDNKKSPVNEHNVMATCQQCHPDAKSNFSLSGANHINLKIESTPLLKWEEIFFKVLTISVIAGLILLILLDLRRKVFSPDYVSESGRPVGLLIALSFFAAILGIGMVALDIRGARWPIISSFGLLVLAMLMYFYLRKSRPAHKEKTYPRFDLIQRLQHICMVSSFIVLVLTGMPLRFAEIPGMPNVQLLFGGFAGARLSHRVAAVVMILTWIWHTIDLLYRWKKDKFSFKNWTMIPTKKDFVDFYHTVLYGVGLRNTPPQFGRFQFREKFDYFAVYWGMPIMVLSGLILWFPSIFSLYLSNEAFLIAYIAHSDESVLAMLAIVVWHFYNVHFNPDAFPMNPAWLTGRLPEGEMQREHPLEKERIDKEQADSTPTPVEH